MSAKRYLESDKNDTLRLMISKSERIKMMDMKDGSKFSYFKRLQLDSRDTRWVACFQCKDNKLYKYDDHGTESVQYHMDNHSKKKDPNQTSFDSFVAVKPRTLDTKKKPKAAATMCATDMRPFITIEDGMENFANALIEVGATRGKVTAKDLLSIANTVKNHVIQLAKDARLKLKEELNGVQYVSCTTDHWTHIETNQEFVTVTVHYFQPVTNGIKNRVIGTFAVDDKTSLLTRSHFADKLKEFDSEHKVRLVVSDNANNMKKAFEIYDWIGFKAHGS